MRKTGVRNPEAGAGRGVMSRSQTAWWWAAGRRRPEQSAPCDGTIRRRSTRSGDARRNRHRPRQRASVPPAGPLSAAVLTSMSNAPTSRGAGCESCLAQRVGLCSARVGQMMVLRYVSEPQGAGHLTLIAEAVPHKPVLILDSARQIGKTTSWTPCWTGPPWTRCGSTWNGTRWPAPRSIPKSPTDGRRVGNQDVILP